MVRYLIPRKLPGRLEGRGWTWLGLFYIKYPDGWSLCDETYSLNYMKHNTALKPFIFSNLKTDKTYFRFGWYL